jgi:hypothetical protein
MDTIGVCALVHRKASRTFEKNETGTALRDRRKNIIEVSTPRWTAARKPVASITHPTHLRWTP